MRRYTSTSRSLSAAVPFPVCMVDSKGQPISQIHENSRSISAAVLFPVCMVDSKGQPISQIDETLQ